MLSNTIEWLTRSEFLKAFETNPVGLEQLASSWISFDEARTLIPIAPLDDPPDGEKGLGQLSDWYGSIGGTLLLLTAYKEAPKPCILLCAQPADSANEPYCWQRLRRFQVLPKPLLNSISWVASKSWNCPESIEFPYHVTAEHLGEKWNLYLGSSREECEELCIFLMEFGSQFDLTVVQSENK